MRFRSQNQTAVMHTKALAAVREAAISGIPNRAPVRPGSVAVMAIIIVACSGIGLTDCSAQEKQVGSGNSEAQLSGETNGTAQAKSLKTSVDQSSDKEEIDPSALAASVRKADREINLLDKKLEETWDYFSSDEGSKMSDAWVIRTVGEQRELVCLGNPKGFLSTKALYSNFRLSFEWKYISDPNSNSGVLVYTQKEPRLWPTAIQVQLHQPLAGCIFPGGDAKSDNSTKSQGLAKPVGEWNSCLLISESGKLSVEINGMKAGEVSGCQPSTGFIALQSEGSETHFRKLKLQILPPPEAATSESTGSDDAAEVDEQIEVKSDDETNDKAAAKPRTFDGTL